MANRYWVGGTGDWNNTNRWSTTSGGASGASVPISTDDVIFNGSSGSLPIVITLGAETVNNFTLSSVFSSGFWANHGFDVLRFSGTSLTVNGTFDVNGADVVFQRLESLLVIASATLGVPFTISAATVSTSRSCYRDINATGAGTWSGTRLGNMGGNTGITFSTPRTLYQLASTNKTWWDNNSWGLSSGASGGQRQPLPQDSVIIDNNSDNNIYTFGAFSGGNVDMSARTTDFSVSGFPNYAGYNRVYGNLIFNASNNAGANRWYMVGEGTMNITSNNSTVGASDLFVVATGSVVLVDNLNIFGTLDVTQGTFDANDKNISVGKFSSSNVVGSATLLMKTGTWSVTDTGVSWDASTATSLTITAGTSTLSFVAGSGTFNGGGKIYATVNFGGGFTGSNFIINNSSTFSTLNFLDTNSTYTLQVGTTQTTSSFEANGSSGNTILIRSTTSGTKSFISADVAYVSYVDVKDNHALGTGILFNDSDGGVDSGNNTNWCFTPGCALPAYHPSLISSVTRVEQNLPFPQFVIGGRNAGSYKLFKKSDIGGFNIFRTKSEQIGKDFDIMSISFNLLSDLDANTEITPALYFDDESTSVIGTTINNTNYSNDNKLITLTAKNFGNQVHGESNFFLEFRFTGSTLAVIGLPIFIDVDILDT